MDAPPPPSANPARAAAPPPENLWLNLGLNVALPSLLLMKGPAWLGLDPVAALLAALVFPFGYGVYDLWRRRVWNIFSIIGLVGVALTGGIGLLALDPQWVAIKEAGVPLGFAVAVTASLAARRPFVQALLLNPAVVDVARIEAAVAARGREAEFRLLLRNATLIVAASFLLSSALNYALARWLVHSPAGTEAFTAELGRMTLWSWPVIALPSLALTFAALWYVLAGLARLTGLEVEQMFHPEQARPGIKAGTEGGEGNQG